MKKILYLIITLIIMPSCSVTKEAKSSKTEIRNEKILASQELVKKAVESKRFIVRLNRIYFYSGRFVDLVPRSNYIIIEGNLAIIRAAYLGRQYDIRPIAGITMKGETINYKLNNDSSKGKYAIEMKVQKGGDSFDLYITIGKNGSCTASLSSIRIDNVRYSGRLEPLPYKKADNNENNEII